MAPPWQLKRKKFRECERVEKGEDGEEFRERELGQAASWATQREQ